MITKGKGGRKNLKKNSSWRREARQTWRKDAEERRRWRTEDEEGNCRVGGTKAATKKHVLPFAIGIRRV